MLDEEAKELEAYQSSRSHIEYLKNKGAEDKAMGCFLVGCKEHQKKRPTMVGAGLLLHMAVSWPVLGILAVSECKDRIQWAKKKWGLTDPKLTAPYTLMGTLMA
ncbi:hypothetical protein VaNZ11_003684 [Volvox africanus]|uniref:Uncharacterized protein n=1 Tax=Volvox africanus TaxID=51714 RepID=A0ABQ5RWB9_9CHLO|nr:hypothetical protein VaNZ11_003684 [Volvox africanus]